MKILLFIMLLLVIIFLTGCSTNRRRLSPLRRTKTEEQRMIDFEENGIPY